jgi:hypothetical protein
MRRILQISHLQLYHLFSTFSLDVYYTLHAESLIFIGSRLPDFEGYNLTNHTKTISRAFDL